MWYFLMYVVRGSWICAPCNRAWCIPVRAEGGRRDHGCDHLSNGLGAQLATDDQDSALLHVRTACTKLEMVGGIGVLLLD